MTSRMGLLVCIALSALGCGTPSGDDASTSSGVSSESSLTSSATESVLPQYRGPATLRLASRDDSGVVVTRADGEAAAVLAHNPSSHPFFASIGSNGRACVHCHVPAAGWTITPETMQMRFTNPLDARDVECLKDPYRCRAENNPARWGLDPVFRLVDGAVSPKADVSTPQKRLEAYRLLLEKALIRVGMPIPANAEFKLVGVDDPYHYASAAELSLFRRPLPSANLGTGEGDTTLTTVMWDGRETLAGQTITADLAHQSNSATLGHAESARTLTAREQAAIVAFETHLHTAQQRDFRAGRLDDDGAYGGVDDLREQPFYVGINDVLTGDARTRAPFDRNVFDLYTAWSDDDRDCDRNNGAARAQKEARESIARGEEIFNTKAIAITGVGGLNDALNKRVINGTCTTCHDSPNYGHHSVPLPINIGIADGARRTADLPLYTLQNKATGERVKTTDPGRALVTGRWADIGKFKGPILRGLAARAPYFHNGSADSLTDVVKFYDERFSIGLSYQEKRDLVAFLKAL